jgi:hypothetical protein
MTFCPIQDRIFEALIRHPRGLHMAQLIAEVYRGCREPDWAQGSVQVSICVFNKKRKAAGSSLRIHSSIIGNRRRTGGGTGSIYQVWVVK